MNRELWAHFFLCLVCSTLVLPALAYPNQAQERKFAVKPNDYKKQQHLMQQQHLQAQQSNNPQNQDSFWQSLVAIGMQVMNMFLQPQDNSIDKNDNNIQGGGTPGSGGFSVSWTQVLSMALRLVTMALGTDQGVDKVDNENSAMQGMLTAVLTMLLGNEDPAEVQTMAKQAGELIQVVVTLLEALKTSFSQRAIQARALNTRDPIAFASIASIDIAKGYVKTLTTGDDTCKQRIMCEANRECVEEVDDLGYLACRFGSYLTAMLIEKTSYTPADLFTEAGKRGRQMQDCQQAYLECNTV